jgi:hypothetical protein
MERSIDEYYKGITQARGRAGYKVKAQDSNRNKMGIPKDEYKWPEE